LDNKKVLEKMAAADCLVVPSLCYENSPSVVYEAVSQGLPFIGSDLGGLAELTETFDGLKFKADDALDLQKKMQWAYDNTTALQKRALAGKEKFDRYRAAAREYLRAILETIGN
jgi:glycosyltransferase involved in cell wall biosynthesis